MTENEKLRALLAEAQDCLHTAMEYRYSDLVEALIPRIDAALAEPVVECARCETLRELADTAAAEQGLAQRRMMEAQRERDEAVAAFHEATRLRSGIQQARIKAENERDEARAKLALLERHYSPEAAAKLRAELAKANAEIASLRWDRETACENTPTRGCECPGCGLARERAERGEV